MRLLVFIPCCSLNIEREHFPGGRSVHCNTEICARTVCYALFRIPFLATDATSNRLKRVMAIIKPPFWLAPVPTPVTGRSVTGVVARLPASARVQLSTWVAASPSLSLISTGSPASTDPTTPPNGSKTLPAMVTSTPEQMTFYVQRRAGTGGLTEANVQRFYRALLTVRRPAVHSNTGPFCLYPHGAINEDPYPHT